MAKELKPHKWIMHKGIVQCENCGYITLYGYTDKNKLCFNCGAGFFRYKENEVRSMDLVTEGVEYETIEEAIKEM